MRIAVPSPLVAVALALGEMAPAHGMDAAGARAEARAKLALPGALAWHWGTVLVFLAGAAVRRGEVPVGAVFVVDMPAAIWHDCGSCDSRH